MLLDITATGYKLYQKNIHRHQVTGYLHGMFMPTAIVGFGIIIQRWFGQAFNTMFLFGILSLQTYGYSFIDPNITVVNFLFYSVVIWLLHAGYPTLHTLWLSRGVPLFLLSWVMMECVGHWYLENQKSDLSQVINSVYWTQLYGFQALMDRVPKITDDKLSED